jgi:molecular chaperone GrpE
MNPETANVQNEEQTKDRAASSAESVQENAPGEEGSPLKEGEEVQAVDEKASAGAAEPADEALPEEPEDPVAALEEAVAQAQAKAEEYLDGWQRARAEFANYRRREQVRREQSESEIAGRVLSHFLPVLDDLERAFSAVPPGVQDSAWMNGLSLVAQKLLAGMEKEGVAPIPVELGEPFDPNLHMAVLHLPCADYEEGQIAMVLQRGYTMGERVLRPAMVQVSSGKTCDDGDTAGEPDLAAEEKDTSPAEAANE